MERLWSSAWEDGVSSSMGSSTGSSQSLDSTWSWLAAQWDETMESGGMSRTTWHSLPKLMASVILLISVLDNTGWYNVSAIYTSMSRAWQYSYPQNPYDPIEMFDGCESEQPNGCFKLNQEGGYWMLYHKKLEETWKIMYRFKDDWPLKLSDFQDIHETYTFGRDPSAIGFISKPTAQVKQC